MLTNRKTQIRQNDTLLEYFRLDQKASAATPKPSPIKHVITPSSPSVMPVAPASVNKKNSVSTSWSQFWTYTSFFAILAFILLMVWLLLGMLESINVPESPAALSGTKTAMHIETSTPPNDVNMSSVITPQPSLFLDSQVLTPSQRDSEHELGYLSFCAEHEFDQATKKCVTSKKLFIGIVKRLYVSWTPSESYKGSSFTKKWYIDDHLILIHESTSEYGYLEVVTLDSLKPGDYVVELYVTDVLIQNGTFQIREKRFTGKQEKNSERQQNGSQIRFSQ